MSVGSTERLKQARCGACGQSMAGSAHCNLVTLRRRPTWEYPSSQNFITGDGPCAIAVVCDTCIESDQAEIREVVELSGDQVIYHDADGLEQLPPEPTHAIGKDPTTGQEGIKCLVCGMVSWHPDDVLQKYCAHCRKFHPIT